MPDTDTHPSNLVRVDLAVFDGPYEGQMRSATAAEWLRRYAYSSKICSAIRGARDGVEGISFPCC